MREPTNDEQRLMILGGFETLEDYLEWLNSPTDQDELIDETDYEQEVIEELDLFGEQEELDAEEAEHERMMDEEEARLYPSSD
jgi:hypothetical protein